LDNHLIDQIRQANDIVDVIQAYVPLKHMGSNWRGVCPFHDDTRPSMYVSQPKQIFKCFACGKAGNVFTFVQEYEKLNFIEAVKKLAQRSGFSIPEHERGTVASTRRQQLLQVYKSAGDFFAECLFEHADNALEYLAGRKFSPQTAKELQLGFALPSNRSLLNHLLKEGYGVDLLKISGLFTEYSGALNDLFRDRLMFPIHNNTGDVIAFGGRIIEEKENSGKYINSPGTDLYTKGKELYGLFKTKYNISKMDYSLVCEGYFDFLRLYEHGFVNSVASLGTALTLNQVLLLNRFSRKTVMLYDSDKAGVKAAIRGGMLCLSKGMQVRIATLPEGEDPDSFLLAFGKDALQELIDKAPTLIDFMATSTNIDEPVKERIDLLLDALRQLDDPIQRELFVADISRSFGITTQSLLSSLRRSGGTTTAQPEDAPSPSKLSETSMEMQLLGMALKDADSYNLLANELSVDYFNSKLCRQVFSFLQSRIPKLETWNPAALLDDIENDEIKNSMAELLFEDLHLANLSGMIRDLKLRKLKRDLEVLDKAINRDSGNLELLKQKETLSREYRRMTKRVVNKVLF
jgi:DNA primase